MSRNTVLDSCIAKSVGLASIHVGCSTIVRKLLFSLLFNMMVSRSDSNCILGMLHNHCVSMSFWIRCLSFAKRCFPPNRLGLSNRTRRDGLSGIWSGKARKISRKCKSLIHPQVESFNRIAARSKECYLEGALKYWTGFAIRSIARR